MTNKWISEANACDPRLLRNASVINYAVERVNIEFHFIANPLAEFFILNLGSACTDSPSHFIHGLKINVIKR